MAPSPAGTKPAAVVGATLVVNAAYAVVILAACITSGSGCGGWLGEALATAFGADEETWAKWCRIYGGLIGFGLAGGILVARFVG